jgi:hypothetical protein
MSPVCKSYKSRSHWDSVPQYHAVKCKTCGATITLDGPIVGAVPGGIIVGVPEGPVPCNECGSSYLYDSDDCFEIEVD